jgi:hypothetical protein
MAQMLEHFGQVPVLQGRRSSRSPAQRPFRCSVSRPVTLFDFGRGNRGYRDDELTKPN